jgi:hypothetical protein
MKHGATLLGATACAALALCGCASSKPSAPGAEDFLSGFAKSKVERVDSAALTALDSSFRVSQDRTRTRPPRNEREAIESLRQKRQEYLRRIR